MSTRSKTVCFSPDVHDLSTIILMQARGDGGRILRNNKKRNNGKQRLSPMRFLIRLGTKVADAIRGVSIRRRSSTKVSSSSSSSSTLVKSRSISDLNDPHRAETVEDCIEFLHSSSCRERPSFSLDSTKFC